MLTKVRGSKLEAMFSGDTELPTLENGVVFVDRDAEPFQLIISYLRNDCEMPLIKDDELAERFKLEMKFWGLNPPIEDLE